MKLYATTTSERASKGQGGNQFLSIDINDELNQVIAHIYVKDLENGNGEITINNFIRGQHTTDKFRLYSKKIVKAIKGKQKKGDDNTCKICGKKSDFLTRDGKCQKCDDIVA